MMYWVSRAISIAFIIAELVGLVVFIDSIFLLIKRVLTRKKNAWLEVLVGSVLVYVAVRVVRIVL